MSMFCYQCQETAGCKGCTVKGVCGKTEDLAKLQDLLVYIVRGISAVSTKAREVGVIDKNVDNFVVESLFATITNANFDKNVFVSRAKEGLALREALKVKAKNAGADLANLPEAAMWTGETEEALNAKAGTVGVLATENEDVRSLRELITYGAKGLCAYLKHAKALKKLYKKKGFTCWKCIGIKNGIYVVGVTS